MLTLYHAKFPWIAQLCVDSDSSTLLLEDAFPELSSEALVEEAKAVQRWKKHSALAGRKLVPVTSSMPQDSAMHAVEAIIGAISHSPVKTAELHKVEPELLIAPLTQGMKTPLSAVSLRIGDWVACMSGESETLPPFGAYGVVVAVHDGFADIRTLERFAGGSDLDGRVQKGYGSRLSSHLLLSLTTISGPDASQLAAPAVASSAPVAQAARSPARSTSGAAPVLTVAEPAVPDGTRGFHQHTGHGRGKPLQQPTAKAAVAALAGPPQHRNVPQAVHPPVPAHSLPASALAPVPDFLQKLLAMPVEPAAILPQAGTAKGPNIQHNGIAHVEVGTARASGSDVPDFLRKLLGESETQKEIPASDGGQFGAAGPTAGARHLSSCSRETPPDGEEETLKESVIQAAATPAVSGAQTASYWPPALSGPARVHPFLQRLSPPSHAEFARMQRQEQLQVALQSMKELVYVLQSLSQDCSSSGQNTLANVLAKVCLLLVHGLATPPQKTCWS